MKNGMLLMLIVSITVFGGCDNKQIEELMAEKTRLAKEVAALKQEAIKGARLDFIAKNLSGIKVNIKTNLGEISVGFFPQKAPIHVWNFVVRAESGYYNGTKFHRLIPGFMIQGGDPNTKEGNPYSYGQGGPLVSIPHEFNDIRHKPGILSMARVSDPSVGAGSQFFIMHADSPHLDGQYTAFGEVISGMDVVNKIAMSETNRTDPALRDQPVTPVIIERMTVSR